MTRACHAWSWIGCFCYWRVSLGLLVFQWRVLFLQLFSQVGDCFKIKKKKEKKRNGITCAKILMKGLVCAQGSEKKVISTSFRLSSPSPGDSLGNDSPFRHLDKRNTIAPLGSCLSHRGHRWVIREEGMWGERSLLRSSFCIRLLIMQHRVY